MLEARERFNIGDRFGYLVVTSDSLIDGSHKYRKVICDCGQENRVWEHNLSNTVSCGCAVGEKYRPLYELPEKQKNMRHAFVRSGKLLVVEDQTVYRVKGKLLYKCAVSKTSRGYRYDQISYQENGKQKHVTVHRLMAEAFIPNPGNKPQVNHIDGDPGNNNLENLEWVTAKENIQHAYDTGLIRTLANTPYRCIKCENPVMNNKGLCKVCKSGLNALKGRLLSKQKQRERFKNIDSSLLKPKYQKVVRSRYRGDTLQEIGDRWGVTREYIRQLEKQVLDKEPIIYRKRKVPSKMANAGNSTSLSITLKAARINAGMGANEVAQKLEVTAATLYNWERYESKVPLDKFTKACNIYGLSPDNICGYKVGGWFVPEKFNKAIPDKNKGD